ncbi:nuclear transport factor 2 family protein (plasmid) [Nocardioides sp. R1-1]
MIRDYADAWNRHAVDDMIQFHTEDTVWTLPAVQMENVGKAAVYKAFESVFEYWPDVRFTERRMRYGGDIVAIETYLYQTLKKPLELGNVVIQPNGKTVRIDLCDILTLEDGKISRKDSYMNLPYQQEILEGGRRGGLRS